jgi:hypothetical protein
LEDNQYIVAGKQMDLEDTLPFYESRFIEAPTVPGNPYGIWHIDFLLNFLVLIDTGIN